MSPGRRIRSLSRSLRRAWGSRRSSPSNGSGFIRVILSGRDLLELARTAGPASTLTQSRRSGTPEVLPGPVQPKVDRRRAAYIRQMEGRVTRVGDTVRRPLERWSASVHDLLRHLERKGFPSPHVLDVVGDVEVLSWIEGESGDEGWAKVVPERGLRKWGHFLRTYHDAVADFLPAAGSVWSSGIGTCGDGELVCHGDFGPWNAVWDGDEIVGLIDWDHARPAPALFDVAYGLEYAAPFRSDAESMDDLGHPGPPDRRRRVEVFCEGYGIDVPADLVTQVARQQRQISQTVEKLASEGVEPQLSWVREGYLDELAERVRFTESLRL